MNLKRDNYTHFLEETIESHSGGVLLTWLKVGGAFSDYIGVLCFTISSFKKRFFFKLGNRGKTHLLACVSGTPFAPHIECCTGSH